MESTRSSQLLTIDLLEPVKDVVISQQSSRSGFELLGLLSHRYKSFVLAMLLCVQFGFEHRKTIPNYYSNGEDALVMVRLL